MLIFLLNSFSVSCNSQPAGFLIGVINLGTEVWPLSPMWVA